VDWSLEYFFYLMFLQSLLAGQTLHSGTERQP